jgi:hypothetical protein
MVYSVYVISCDVTISAFCYTQNPYLLILVFVSSRNSYINEFEISNTLKNRNARKPCLHITKSELFPIFHVVCSIDDQAEQAAQLPIIDSSFRSHTFEPIYVIPLSTLST